MRDKAQKMRFLKRAYFDFAHFWIYATYIYVEYCVKVAVLVLYWFRSYSDLKLQNRTNLSYLCICDHYATDYQQKTSFSLKYFIAEELCTKRE